MSKLIGLGQGLQQAGDIFSKMFLLRDQQKRENEAIQRALTQQGIENVNRRALTDIQSREAEDVHRNTEDQIASRGFDDALKVATNFPQAEVPEAQAQEWMKDRRAPLLQPKRFGQGVEDQTPAGGPIDDPMLGKFADNVMGTPGRQGYATRLPESEKYRIAQQQNASRMAIQSMRRDMFNQKLAQDSSLAELRASLTAEQINSAERRAEALIGYNYDALDYKGLNDNANRQSDLMIQELKAEVAKNRTNMFLNIPGLMPANSPSAAPAAPAAPPRQAPQVAPPAHTGPGVKPTNTAPQPTAGPGSLADALKRKQQAKSQQ